MFYYTNYDEANGKIKSSGMCSNEGDVELNKRDGFEQVKGIFADGRTQKIETRYNGMIQYRVLVDKTPAEIEADKRPEKPESKKAAHITKGQLQALLTRISNLETKGQ